MRSTVFADCINLNSGYQVSNDIDCYDDESKKCITISYCIILCTVATIQCKVQRYFFHKEDSIKAFPWMLRHRCVLLVQRFKRLLRERYQNFFSSFSSFVQFMCKKMLCYTHQLCIKNIKEKTIFVVWCTFE